MAQTDRPNRLPIILGITGLIALGAFLYFFLGGSDEAHVTGKVILDRVPVASAQVVFVGEEAHNQAPIPTQSDPDGNYKLIGTKGGGILPGKYRVVVSKMALPNGTLPTGEELEQARSNGLLNNILPTGYADRSTTPLRFDIGRGHTTITLELTRQPPQAGKP